MQEEWALHEDDDYAAAAIVNSSKVVGITVSPANVDRRATSDDQGTQTGVWQIIDRLQQLGLANPVLDMSVP